MFVSSFAYLHQSFLNSMKDDGPGFIKDKMEFCFSFDKAGPTIKYVTICSSSTSCGRLEEGYFRLVDYESKKELMFYKVDNPEGYKSVPVGLFVRNEYNYVGRSPEKSYEFVNDFFMNKVNELF
ncbi:hypothetical protein M9Y10_008654 [Tritrichomonas musculus]|uniref:Uncharacterized protein n=1 Tax=Tritrichomonas musculus TaxID=1915356 RepID=A0ABR2IZH3_9EUKA